MKRDPRPAVLGMIGLLCLAVAGCTTMAKDSGQPRDLEIIARWSGDYPVDRLDLLPGDQRGCRTGYLGERQTFAAVWRALMPGKTVPDVDFDRNLVAFSRNLDFYNRTNIFKVTLSGGVAEIMAMETMSAIPIEDQLVMALAVVPHDGIEFVRCGEASIPVAAAR